MKGFQCQYCGSLASEVIVTVPLSASVLRVRSCLRCGQAFETVETYYSDLSKQISKYKIKNQTTQETDEVRDLQAKLC